MKLLVLGRKGQLGAELVDRASRHGFEPIGLGSEDLDVTDADAVRSALDPVGPQAVVNATAYHVVPDCDRSPERAFAVNAAAVKTMAEACHASGVAFATFSTDYVFDGRKGAPYVEDDRPNPLQTYGVSKLAGELLCALEDPGALIIRTCGVYGGAGGSRAKRGNFVLTMLREARTKPALEVSSEQIVSPTYAADLADATLALIARRPEGGLYHLVNEGRCSWAEFAAAIVACAGGSMKIVPVDRGGQSGAARRPRFSALANVRAAALGVTLPPWEDGLRRYVATLREPPGS
jgi:dTDP-4-dehydrorhamnose reductase